LKGAKQAFAAAVADFVEEPAVAACGVDGFEEVEVGGEFDFVAGVVGGEGEGEVDDVGVLREVGVEGEVDFADELFVGVWNGFATFDADSEDASLGGEREEKG
jgi:hypothetical protein